MGHGGLRAESRRLSRGSCPTHPTPPLSWREFAASDRSMWRHKAHPPRSPATAPQGPPGSSVPSVVTSARASIVLALPGPSPLTVTRDRSSPQPDPSERTSQPGLSVQPPVLCVCPILAGILLLSGFSQNLPSPIYDHS